MTASGNIGLIKANKKRSNENDIHSFFKKNICSAFDLCRQAYFIR